MFILHFTSILKCILITSVYYTRTIIIRLYTLHCVTLYAHHIHFIYIIYAQDFHLAKRYYDQAATYDIGIVNINCCILYNTIKTLFMCIPYTIHTLVILYTYHICYKLKGSYIYLILHSYSYNLYYTYTCTYTSYSNYIYLIHYTPLYI